MKVNEYRCAGRLTRDFETKTFPNGGGVCKSAVAVDNSYKKGDEWVNETLFLDIVFFYKTDAQASWILKNAKGDEVYVSGKLKQETWEQDGNKRSKVLLVADSVQKISSPGEKEDTPTKGKKSKDVVMKDFQEDDETPF